MEKINYNKHDWYDKELITEDSMDNIENGIAQATDKINEVIDEVDNINKRQYLSVTDFGVVGDGVTDDTQNVQKAFDYCSNNNIALFIPTGNYLLSDTINISKAIYVFGRSIASLSNKLGFNSTNFIINHTKIGFNISADTQTFSGVTFKDFSIINKQTQSSNTAIFINKFSNSTFDHISISDFKNGIGMNFSNENFGGQYSLINNCLFGNCKIGVNVQYYNGVHIINSMFDGNNNFSDIDKYQNGYIPDSIAIKLDNSGDSSRILNNRIQGFNYGCYVGIGSAHSFAYNRIEGCYYGFYFGENSQKLILAEGNFVNNYILLSKNNLNATDRFGYGLFLSGSKHIINNFINSSCFYCLENNSSTNIRKDSQHFSCFINSLDDYSELNIPVEYTCKVINKKIAIGNIENIDKTYANRWQIIFDSKYITTDSLNIKNNENCIIENSENAVNGNVKIIFNKYNQASELKNILISFDIVQY